MPRKKYEKIGSPGVGSGIIIDIKARYQVELFDIINDHFTFLDKSLVD